MKPLDPLTNSHVTFNGRLSPDLASDGFDIGVFLPRDCGVVKVLSGAFPLGTIIVYHTLNTMSSTFFKFFDFISR